MVASATPLPVIGVPVPLAKLDGLDSLLSIVQMPAGVPVATVSIGGARNAGLLAVRILASADDAMEYREASAADGKAVGDLDVTNDDHYLGKDGGANVDANHPTYLVGAAKDGTIVGIKTGVIWT
jgi:5-(carboxyamino)imidazole ribonucleotide mutase